MSYGVADSSGKVLFDIPIDIPGARSPHDMGVTRNYTVLHDLPFSKIRKYLRSTIVVWCVFMKMFQHVLV